MVDVRQLNEDTIIVPEYDHHLKHPSQVKQSLDLILINLGLEPKSSRHIATKILNKNPSKSNVTNRRHKLLCYLEVLQKIRKITELSNKHKEDLDYLRSLFPLFGLKTILGKIHKNELVTKEEILW